MANFLIKLIKVGIGFILFLPLYIGGQFFFPFIFPKIWLFQLTVEIIFFFYLILALSDSRFRPRFKNSVFIALGLLTLALIITGFTGIDAFRSFWGNTERMSGLVAWFHFAAFAVILSSVLKTEKDWRNFLGIAVFVSVLEFFYVLAQYFNASWVWLPGSVIGTIGNTDLLGTYAIFAAFFSLYLWETAKTSVKNFWMSAFLLNIGTLFLASSRGAILGFGAGIFIYFIFIASQRKVNFKIFGALIVILILVYGAIFLARNSNFVKNNRQLSRVTHISLQDDTVQQRFTEWGIAWNAFKAKPIFGYGPNNYLYLHNAFLNPRVYNLRETNFDRAHNAYLDYASMGGISGLAGYLFLIAVLFWTFFKNKLWSFASLAAAYAVQSFFVFDSPASYIALFLTIGFASYIAGNPNDQIPNSKQIPNPKTLKPQTVAAFSLISCVLLLYAVWQVSVKPAVVNYKFVRAFNGIEAGLVAPEEALMLYKESLKYETLGTSEFRNQYVNWLQKNLGKFNPENRLEVLDFGINELEKEVKDHPSVFSYLNLGQLYNYKVRGLQDEKMKKEFFAKTAGAYDKALELAPKRLEVYYSYLQLSFDEKNYSRGIELMERAALAAPDYWQTHWYLGLAHVAAGDDEVGTAAINKALVVFYLNKVDLEKGRLKFNYDDARKYATGFAPKQEILGAVNPYIKLEMWPELLLLYLSAAHSDPGDIGIHQSLALVYQSMGLLDRAQKELKIIDSLQKK